MSTRDDFTQGTKDLLAGRVGYLCSNPACRAPTRGPNVDPRKTTNVSTAANITGAAPGTPKAPPGAR